MKIKRSTLVLLKKVLIFSLITISIVYLLYIYFRTPTFTIYSYELVGVPEMYKDTLIARLKDVASQKQYKILPSNRVFTYRSTAIKSAVVDVLPNSEKVSLRPVGLHTLRITVTSYIPLFKIDEFRGVTKEGVIYNEFKDIHALPTLFIASSTSKEVVEDGIHSTVITGIEQNTLTNISKLITKINSVIFTVSKIDIDAYGDITLYDERGISKILFAGTENIDKVWSNLVSAIDTDPLKSKLTTNKEKLEYLDARFGNKVFFKFTNDTKTAIIQSYATTTATTTFSH